MNQRNALVTIIAGLLILNLGFSVYFLNELNNSDDEIRQLEQNQERLEKQYTSILISTATNASDSTETFELPTFDSEVQSGRMVPMSVTAAPSAGIYVHSRSSIVGEQMQISFYEVKEYVESSTYDPEHDGLVISVNPPDDWDRINGQSASLGVGVAYAALHANKTLNPNVTMTGYIRSDGSIGPVQNVDEKVDAAATMGYSMILVPPGYSVSHPGIRVIPVASFDEATQYAIKSID